MQIFLDSADAKELTHWLGEGVVDFKKIVAKAKEVCPPISLYNKPITGRPPQLIRRVPNSLTLMSAVHLF